MKDRNPVKAFTALLQAFRPSLWTNRGSLLIAVPVVAFFAAPAGQAHNVPGLHNRVHAVQWAFCGKQTKRPCSLGWQAVRVAKCESGWSLAVHAGNGQYRGMFQFGSHARTTYGFGWNPWAQSAAAYRYYRAAGWSPWSCARIVGLL
jgi:hypothetical protein